MATATELSTIRATLLSWYDREHRDFPWRRTRDPYAVLVSEVMLQQTQASRVVDRFDAFMERFPTAESLAAAAPAAVLAAWSGLGYNRRAIALQAAARAVIRDGWPRDVAGLARLPGVGPYTARAIASLAFDLPVGVLDTNVRRWLVRRLAAPDRPRTLQSLADDIAATGTAGDAATWTHASMEFGAGVCRSRAPRCAICPIADGCPSRDAPARVPVTPQRTWAGSDRSYRGALMKALSTAPGHRLREAGIGRRLGRSGDPPTLDDAGWARILEALEADGLVHRADGDVRLGAATIGR
jgi:A/G-specific adenine glycosylase